jgi:hypothetical protein
MNIYSIEEIVNATKNILDANVDRAVKKSINTSNESISPDVENIIREAEKAQILKKKNAINIELPLILKNQTLDKEKVDSFNFKIKIKPDVKDHMINELYIYLKKKLKKNTLKLIIDEQVEIKNLKNRINFLKQKENNLKIDYELLKNNYELIIENIEILKNENNNLLNNLNKATDVSEQLSIENGTFKDNLNEQKINLDETLRKNRSFEINNSELKKTISRYIINHKKMQEEINLLTNSKNLKFEDADRKVKFYQNENIRLSSELLIARKNNETIKFNLENIELEKQKISNKIKELNNTITEKSNIILSPDLKKTPEEVEKNINHLNDKEQKSLDEVISRIFAKI